MEPYMLILVHVFTMLIVLFSAHLFYVHIKRYRNNLILPSLYLALYFLSFAVYYFFIFLLRFPTEENNLTLNTAIIPLGAFVLDPFLPLFSSLFASFTLSPKRGTQFSVPLVALSIVSIVLIMLNPPIVTEGAGGITEWSVPEGANIAIVIDIVVSLIVCAYMAFYTMTVKDRTSIAKGLLLTAGFLLVSYLVHFEENFGLGSAIYIRRALILIALLIINIGFTMPEWLRKRI
jgi:hypothetical protein